MKIIKKYLVPIIAVIIVVIASVKINIVNTEALSPLGNSDDNFKLVSAEFGEDFQEFIMDKSSVKIYIGEEDDGEAMMKIYNREINLTKNNFFMNSLDYIGNCINKAFSFIRDKFNKNTKSNIEDVNGNNIKESNVETNNVDNESLNNDKNLNDNMNSNSVEDDTKNSKNKNNSEYTDFDKVVDEFIKNINN